VSWFHFRHAVSESRLAEKAKKIGIPDVHNRVICGHNEDIGVGLFSWNQDEVVMLDTSVYESTIWLGAIGYDSGKVSVSLISLDFRRLSVDTVAR
jgi:hypothetical protein